MGVATWGGGPARHPTTPGLAGGGRPGQRGLKRQLWWWHTGAGDGRAGGHFPRQCCNRGGGAAVRPWPVPPQGGGYHGVRGRGPLIVDHRGARGATTPEWTGALRARRPPGGLGRQVTPDRPRRHPPRRAKKVGWRRPTPGGVPAGGNGIVLRRAGGGGGGGCLPRRPCEAATPACRVGPPGSLGPWRLMGGDRGVSGNRGAGNAGGTQRGLVAQTLRGGGGGTQERPAAYSVAATATAGAVRAAAARRVFPPGLGAGALRSADQTHRTAQRRRNAPHCAVQKKPRSTASPDFMRVEPCRNL